MEQQVFLNTLKNNDENKKENSCAMNSENEIGWLSDQLRELRQNFDSCNNLLESLQNRMITFSQVHVFNYICISKVTIYIKNLLTYYCIEFTLFYRL